MSYYAISKLYKLQKYEKSARFTKIAICVVLKKRDASYCGSVSFLGFQIELFFNKFSCKFSVKHNKICAKRKIFD